MSVCKNCNADLGNGDYKFCPSCGTPTSEIVSGEVVTEPAAAPEKQLSMKWYKFVVSFPLFLAALLNLANAVKLFSGASLYEGMDDSVLKLCGGYEGVLKLFYDNYKGLEAINRVYGVLLIAIAVLCIVTRFKLASYKKTGPFLLYCVYGANILANLIYAIGMHVVMSGSKYMIEISDFGFIYVNGYAARDSSIVYCIITAVILCLNIVYFKKRAHLFCN